MIMAGVRLPPAAPSDDAAVVGNGWDYFGAVSPMPKRIGTSEPAGETRA